MKFYLRHFFSSLSLMVGFALSVVFVLGDSKTFLRILAPIAPIWPQYKSLVLFGLGVGFLISWWLQKFYQSYESPKGNPTALVPKQPPNGIYLIGYQVFMSAVLVFQTFRFLDDPLDPDEWEWFSHADLQNDGLPWYLKALNPAVHFLSDTLSRFSIEAFGTSVYTARIPAVLFTLGFLVLLFQLSRKYLPQIATVLIYAHLAVNPMPYWYFHSIRGYISMMVVALLQIYLLWPFVTYGLPLSRRHFWIFTIVSTLSVFTHGYGGILTISLFLALVPWLIWNQPRLTPPAQKQSILIVTAMGGIVLWTLIILAGGIAYFHGTEWTLNQSERAGGWTIWAASMVALGIGQQPIFRCLLVVAAILLISQIKKLREDFWGLTLIIGLSFVAGMTASLKGYVTGRFFLGFLLIFILWAGMIISNLQNRLLRRSLLAALTLTLILPQGMYSQPTLFILPQDDFYAFIQGVKAETKKATSPCFSFSWTGKYAAIHAEMAKHFYLNQGDLKDNYVCVDKFHIHLDRGYPEESFRNDEMLLKWVAEKLPVEHTLIYSDHKGRILTSLSLPSEPLAFRK